MYNSYVCRSLTSVSVHKYCGLDTEKLDVIIIRRSTAV